MPDKESNAKIDRPCGHYGGHEAIRQRLEDLEAAVERLNVAREDERAKQTAPEAARPSRTADGFNGSRAREQRG